MPRTVCILLNVFFWPHLVHHRYLGFGNIREAVGTPIKKNTNQIAFSVEHLLSFASTNVGGMLGCMLATGNKKMQNIAYKPL